MSKLMRAELKSMYSARVWDEWVDFLNDQEVAKSLRLAREARKREP